MQNESEAQPHLVIVGAGFGGLAVAMALRRARLRITMIDRHNYHTFLPLLYQVATAGLEPQDITHPVRAILRRCRNATFRMEEVVGGDLDRHTLQLGSGEHITYDHLVLAPGSETETFDLPGVREHGFGLHGLDDARAFRSRWRWR